MVFSQLQPALIPFLIPVQILLPTLYQFKPFTVLIADCNFVVMLLLTELKPELTVDLIELTLLLIVDFMLFHLLDTVLPILLTVLLILDLIEFHTVESVDFTLFQAVDAVDLMLFHALLSVLCRLDSAVLKNLIISSHVSVMPSSSPRMMYSPCSCITLDGL